MADGMKIIMDEASRAIVDAKLIALSDFKREAIIDRALRDGVRVIARQGRANLKARNPIGSKYPPPRQLLKAVTTYSKKKKAKAYGGFIRGTNKTTNHKGSFAHLVDRGTVERWTEKGLYRGTMYKGKKTKHYTPHGQPKFWTDAFEQKKGQAQQTIMKAIDDCIRLIMNR